MPQLLNLLRDIAVLQDSMRRLRHRLDSAGALSTTFWFDFVQSGDGVLIQGFADADLPDGTGISHDVEIAAGLERWTCNASRRISTSQGQDLIDTTGDLACTDESQITSIVKDCVAFFDRCCIDQ